MRTIETTHDKAVFFDYDVWMQEHQLITFTHKWAIGATGIVRLYLDTTDNEIARYRLDANSMVVIDVTDLIRSLYGETHTFILRCNHRKAEDITIDYAVAGLINPESVIIPYRNVDLMRIEAPTMIYANEGTIESLVEVMLDMSVDRTRAISCNNEILRQGLLTTIPVGGDFSLIERFSPVRTKILRRYTLRPQVCGHRYALVRWTSAFGSTKLFTWEIVETSTQTNEDVNIVTLDGSFNRLKGRLDMFNLFLDNLSAYDLWYYGDICHSSKVEVSIDGGVTFRQVDVMTDSVTIPDGDSGEFNKLKVKVKYREYDAVTM